MTTRRPPEGETAGNDPTAAAEALLSETAEVVRQLLAQVRAGEFGKAEALAREQAQLRKALLAAITERQTIERLKRESGAEAPNAALDLVAAREEIGRRLARLRAAAGADGVSGKPE